MFIGFIGFIGFRGLGFRVYTIVPRFQTQRVYRSESKNLETWGSSVFSSGFYISLSSGNRCSLENEASHTL